MNRWKRLWADFAAGLRAWRTELASETAYPSVSVYPTAEIFVNEHYWHRLTETEVPYARKEKKAVPAANALSHALASNHTAVHAEATGLTSQNAPAPTTGVAVQLRGVSKAFGQREVLHPIDLHIQPGEFVAIVGRSGCGKSTLLRLVAGLESATTGEIQIDTNVVHGLNEKTRIMFQDARLLPWKPVQANVALGLDTADHARALDVLAQVGLADRAQEWPANLSGGQRQRVALARALVHQPQLLLLDEPLGALDALTRIEMHALIESLWRTRGFTALLVTHDVQEAVALADRVLLIEEGRIALDVPVDLPYPRERGSAALAQLEKQILDRVLAKPAVDSVAEEAYVPALRWRWAV